LVITITAWQEKGRCWKGHTNLVSAIASFCPPPTSLETNRGTTSPIPETSNNRRTTLNWRDISSNTTQEHPTSSTASSRSTSSTSYSRPEYNSPSGSSFTSLRIPFIPESFLSGCGCLVVLLLLFGVVRCTTQSWNSATSSSVQSVQSPINRLSPEQAIKNYYSNINSSHYQTAWEQLSSRFRSNQELKSDGYTSYIAWWETVKSVELQNVQLLKTETQTATVNTQLQYLMKSGEVVSQSLRFLMVWDTTANNWIIDEVEIISGTAKAVQQPSPKRYISRWKFPLSECGDSNPLGLQNFYPVFVNSTNQESLNYIKSNYCNDAYIKYREVAKRESIQVASFLSKSTADEFARIMSQDSRIGSGEVAEPTLN
jgi:hypothetical protein